MSGFRVLYVCTGNVCRSAAAAVLLRERVPPGDDLQVDSVGTAALEGYGVDAPTVVALRELGLPERAAAAHVARRLTEADIRAAGLVLTATTEHRDRVLRLVPASMRRTFTMREFVRLGADVEGAAGPDDRTAMVREVAGQRGAVEVPPPGADEVGDPFGAGVDAARTMVAQVELTVAQTARLLGLPPTS